MSTHRQYLLILFLFLSFGKWLSAQAVYSLRLQPDGKTYTAFVKPQADWLPPLNSLLHAAKVAIVVPADGLEVNNLQSQFGQWQLASTIEQPLENAGADYFLFKLIGSVADSSFHAGVEMPLFSFENGRPCPGAFELMDMTTDPFVLYNGSNMTIEQSFVVEGAGGEAYTGNYGEEQTDCMAYWDCQMEYSIELLPNGYYEISLHTGNGMPDSLAIQSLKVAIKVPTNFFQLYDLTNLQSNGLAFFGVMRFDAPAEESGFDYISINMAGIGGHPMPIGAGMAVPLMRFGNKGSCQGDSIFLVKNTGDPFFPPNSQNATTRQLVVLENVGFSQPVCVSGTGAAPCLGCLFSDNTLSINDISTAGPVLCLGQTDGMIQLFAEGADSLLYSINGGQTWQLSPVFNDLTIGTYQPVVRGSHYGCMVVAAVPPVVLEEETQINLQLGLTTKACEGNDVALQIMSPVNMPVSTNYTWSGPLGFSAAYPDPVLFDVNVFQSGTYSLMVQVPGCDIALATADLEVTPLPEVPTLITNGSICDGDPLLLTTDVMGEKYEWIGPAGQSLAVLAMPGLTTTGDTTILQKGHPAYLTGDWKVRLTDINGCVVESTLQEVEIKKRPQAFATNNGPVCLGKDAQLSAVPMQGAVYHWRRAGETAIFSFDPQPMLPNVTSETTFELEMEMDGCLSENVAVTTVSLHPKPSAFPLFDYQLADDCSPEDIQLIANASGIGLTYQWTGANNFASQIENPTITNANAASNGSYQLQVTNVHGCTAVSPFQITGVVDAIPTPTIQSTGAVCPGGDIELSILPYSGPQVSYRWFRNGSLITGATSYKLNLDAVQPNDAGMYRIEVQMDACKIKSDDFQVAVLSQPVSNPDFVLTHPCEGATLQFLSNSNGIVNWEWSGPNGFNSTAQSPVIYNTEFDHVGTYSLTVTAANGCSANGSVIVDGILQVPAAPQVATNSPVCPEDEIILVVQNPTQIGTVSYNWINGLGELVGNGGETLTLSTSNPLAVPPFLVKKIVNGCESELSDPIQVEIRPMPVADAENSGAVCPGEQVQLIAAPILNALYTWREAGEPQVLSFEQNPQLAVNDTTVFELTVKTNGCDAIAVDSTTVFTKNRPIINNLTGGGSYCEGAAVQLSGSNAANIAGDIQYTWTGPNGFQYTGTANPTGQFMVDLGVLQAGGEGAYTLQLESNDGCFSLPQSVLVDYVEMPNPPILAVSSNTLCEGETLQLDATGYPGSNVSYRWYFNNGNTDDLLGSSASPTYFVNDLSPSHSGYYFVKTNVDGCEPSPSNLQQVNILGIGNNIIAVNSTTVDEPVCEGDEVQLEATLIPGAVYQWYGPGGFQASGVSPILTTVNMNSAGNYIVEINLPSCSNALTTSTAVFVKPKPDKPTLSGPAEVCAGTDAVIEVSNAEPNALYHFYFTQNNTLIETGLVPSVTLPQILVSQSGSYYAVAEVGGCTSGSSQWFDLQVVPKEIVQAFAGAGRTICNENEVVALSGNEPSVGTGYWSVLNGSTILQPNQATTTAHDLVPGENGYVWEIIQPVCNYYSADTLLVFYEKITAQPDIATLSLTDTLVDIIVLGNDGIVANSWDVRISERPKKGEVKVDTDGMATYRPYPNVFGEDAFEYEVCSMTCPDVCDKAIVQIAIESMGANPSDCFVPNLISPNGDGENDVFVVPCAAVFEGSGLVVFNRCGTPVYQNNNYKNDWDGTYDGGPLPVGTYFYQLSLNDAAGTVLKGYVALLR